MHKFIGYGSLISHSSLKETIKDKKFTMVIVNGYRRVFNLADEKGKNPDVLNLAKNKKCRFNGVLFEITDEELKKIMTREPEYNLEEAEAHDFASGKKLGKGFIVIDYFVSLDHYKRNPDKSYFIMCREAAYALGDDFGKMWDKTTYIADGERVDKWLLNNSRYNSLNTK